MLEACKAYGVERVLIAFDRDDAGETAAAKLAERLGSRGDHAASACASREGWTPTTTRSR